ncbi:MAG: roadblock/LC7 domain-containing protein [Promethearchaeota archaeon]
MSQQDSSNFEYQIQRALIDVKQVAKDVLAVFCSTKQGLPISSIGQSYSELEEVLVSAMSSALHGTAEQIGILKGNFEIVIIRASQGWILIQGEEDILVTALTKPKVNIGLVILAARNAISQISKLLNEAY